MKRLLELDESDFQATLKWLDFLRTNVLTVACPEGYHFIGGLLDRLKKNGGGEMKHE